ncbi:hypothetical protein KQI84_13670 [bacterium]|nr:hypothetical protein [bacterium]
MSTFHARVRSAVGALGALLFALSILPSPALAASDDIPTDLAKTAATYYAHQRWSDAQVATITPYYALDGSVNAWAVEFAEGDDPGIVGTVLVAGHSDVYPMLERFVGPAPHTLQGDRVADLAKISARGEDAIERSYYLGALAVFHEPNDGSRRSDSDAPAWLVDTWASKVFEMSGRALRSGRLPSVRKDKNMPPPQDIWAAFKATGSPPPSPNVQRSDPSYFHINDVPYYHQDDYGANCCAENASAQVMGYWDDHGFGNLIDNGSSQTGHEDEAVYRLMRALSYSPENGTWDYAMAPGLRKFLRDDFYNNNTPIGVSDKQGDEGEYLGWENDLKAELLAGRPLVYSNYDEDEYPEWAHSTTAAGYDEWDYNNKILLLHHNYRIYKNDRYQDTPFELAWDNVPADNESIQKVIPYDDPYECLWSDDFESGLWGGPWTGLSTGSSTQYWGETQARAHGPADDPRPPGGDNDYSLYCVGDHWAAPGPYPKNVHTYIVYGPFSTLGWTKGDMAFWYFFQTNDAADDYVAIAGSTNGTDFAPVKLGQTGGDWTRKSLSLNNYINKPQVWLAFLFHSDSDSTVGEGAYIDDVYIRGWPVLDRLVPPSSIVASDGWYTNEIRITWTAVTGATHYKLMVMRPGESDYTDLTGWRTEREFRYSNNLVAGEDYRFRVYAAASPSGTRESYAMEDTGWARLPVPTGVSASDGTSADYVNVTWDNDGDYYRVFRADDYEAPAAPISDWIQQSYWRDQTAVPGATYWYSLRRATDASETAMSLYTTPTSGWRKLSPPANVTASDGEYQNGVKVEWLEVAGAGAYRVYRQATTSDTAVPLSGWINDDTFTDTTAEAMTTYYYLVSAAADSSGTRESELSVRNAGWRTLPGPSNGAATQGGYPDKIVVTWDAVPGASYYWVYVSEGETCDDCWESSAMTSTSFEYTPSVFGRTYNFWIACGTRSSGVYKSSQAGPFAGWTGLQAPYNVDATLGTYTGGVEITWDTVYGAEFYRVWRSVNPLDPLPSLIMEHVSGNQVVDRTGYLCQNYYYWVSAHTSNGSSERGGPSAGSYNTPPPHSVSASQGTYLDSIVVEWPIVFETSYYQVYRADNIAGVARIAITSWDTETRYVDEDFSLTAGLPYYYWVRSAGNSSGGCANGYSEPVMGYRAENGPSPVEATDGTYTDKVVISWSPSAETRYYRVSRSVSLLGEKTDLSGWFEGISYEDTTAQPNMSYYYWVQASRTYDGQCPSKYSNGDEGYVMHSSWSQPPNLTDGYDTSAYVDTSGQTIIIDNWGSNGSEVRAIRWWGSYANWRTGEAGPVSAPETRPSSFDIAWYSYIDGTPPTIGAQQGKYTIYSYSEDWDDSIYSSSSGTYEHEFVYTAALPGTWQPVDGEMYWLAIQAHYGGSAPSEEWGWLNSDEDENVAPQQSVSGGPAVELAWPVGHRLYGHPFNMAFEILGDRVPPVAPTPSPTPTPYPDSKWTQLPNFIDGYDMASYKDFAGTMGEKIYDDWECTDGSPIVKLEWWGSYLNYGMDDPATIPPPANRPRQFLIRAYEWSDSGGSPRPGSLLTTQVLESWSESGGYAVRSGSMPGTYEHEYRYEASLPTTITQSAGQKYFLSIEAIFDDSMITYPWGWLTSEHEWGSAALRETSGFFTELNYPPGHRLESQPIDASFAMHFQNVPTPTVSPTPSPSPSPTPSATPSPTPSDTPTPSPSPTPDNMSWNQPPSEEDGELVLSWGEVSPRSLPMYSTADDWEDSGSGQAIGTVTFYGGYQGYLSGFAGPVIAPTMRPEQFQLQWMEFTTAAGLPVPGPVTHAALSAVYNETYVASYSIWDQPGQYLHVFRYECQLTTPFVPPAGAVGFFSVRALYSTAFPDYQWGWYTSDSRWNAASVQQVDGGEWTEQVWPPGHPQEGQAVDMAFQFSAPAPTPTPTETPSPTPSATPTPYVYDLQGEQAPNMTDGYDVQSYRDVGNTFSQVVADDFAIPPDSTVQALKWWGSYASWQTATSDEVNSPAWIDPNASPGDPWPVERPLYFEVQVYSSNEDPAPHPGELLIQEQVRNYTETWAGAVEQWQYPGSYEHEYLYQATFNSPWEVAPNERYFLSIQAVYGDGLIQHGWGWLNSDDGHMAAAMIDIGGGWSPMTWPSGHRLDGQDMDMAFELWTIIPPTPSPTPSPTPGPTETPTPTPTNYYSLDVQATNGTVSTDPSQPGYAPASTVQLNAKGADGFHFTNWTGDVPPGSESTNPLPLLMDGNKSLTALFAINTYTLLTSTTNGQVTRQPDKSLYDYGETVRLEAVMDPNWEFIGWIGDVPAGGELTNPIDVTIDQHMTIEAQSDPAGNPMWMLR